MPDPQTILSQSLADTDALAAALAAELRPGDCIALDGGLGAGKTTLVRSIVAHLCGDPRQVSSPTFVLVNLYTTPRGSVFHLDTYRTNGSDDLEAIGFSEMLDQGAIVIVEWANKIDPLLPARTIRIGIEVLGETQRRFHIRRPNPQEDGAVTPH